MKSAVDVIATTPIKNQNRLFSQELLCHQEINATFKNIIHTMYSCLHMYNMYSSDKIILSFYQ